MRSFHGSWSEHEDNKDNLNPAIPGLECYIDRILSYVSSYSPTIGTETGADRIFQLMVDELQAALSSARWVGMNQKPGIDSIRSYLYQDQKSYAHIDVDIVPRIDPQGINSYMISILRGPTDPFVSQRLENFRSKQSRSAYQFFNRFISIPGKLSDGQGSQCPAVHG